MADVTPAARSGLEGLALHAEPGVMRLSEALAMARLVLRMHPATVAGLLQRSGLALPPRINTACVTGQRVVLQLGPDEWWILSEGEAPSVLADLIAPATGDVPQALVDVSERTMGLILAGPAVEDVLASACPLPLALAAFPVGRATRTLFAKAEIVLWRQALDQFHVEVARSYAPYVAGLLATAVRDEAALRRVARLTG